MKNDCLISVCIPAYNCERYIAETLNCLCAQTYPNIEIIVVDDGSRDDTLNRAKSVTDDRIKIISQKNSGAAAARNAAYQFAGGQYVIFLDADDYIQNDFIYAQWSKIAGRDEVIVLSAWGRFYDDDIHSFKLVPMPFDEISFEGWINYHWYHGNPMTTPGRALIPKRLIDEKGTWNERLTLNDDLEFFTRLFLGAEKLLFNPAAIYHYRSGINGLSTKKNAAAYRSLYDSVDLSTELVLEHFPDDQTIKKSCANLWQSTVYELYPFEKGLAKAAEQKIEALGGSEIAYHAGGLTKLLVSLIGWKLTKILKTIR